jgi:hypothetical protein
MSEQPSFLSAAVLATKIVNGACGSRLYVVPLLVIYSRSGLLCRLQTVHISSFGLDQV